MLLGRARRGAEPPLSYAEYRICRTMGWTPEQLDGVASGRVEQFATWMALEEETRAAAGLELPGAR